MIARIIVAFGLLLPQIVLAQFPAQVQVGTRVRVWVPEPFRQEEGPGRRQLLRGTVESVQPDQLRLTVPGTSGSLTIPRSSVERLDISRGWPSRGVSMIERAIGGAIGGAISYALLNDPRRRGGPHYATDWRAAGVGASWGAGLGALVGLAFPHEHWRRVIR
jgi:hypothetical protein